MNLESPGWPPILLAAAVVLLAATGVFYWLRRSKPAADELERRRRSYLNRVGRIAEGHILDIATAERGETTPASGGTPTLASAAADSKRTVVYYSYSISGVTYETAQDITGLEERACRERLIAGQPVSVKYDPANPGNSILIADDWSGLH